MKINTSAIFLITLATAALLSGCSSLTDSIAASTETFTNTTESSTRVSSSNNSKQASAKTQQAVEFAKINWMQLSSNMANGQGEHLSAMADLLDVQPVQKPAFYSMAKSKFSQFFPTSETTPEQLVNSLKIEARRLSKG